MKTQKQDERNRPLQSAPRRQVHEEAVRCELALEELARQHVHNVASHVPGTKVFKHVPVLVVAQPASPRRCRINWLDACNKTVISLHWGPATAPA